MTTAGKPQSHNSKIDLIMDAPIRVLCVDDETSFLSGTKQILEMNGSFQIETVSTVKEAIQKLGEKVFDVVVSDYQMPEKDGLDFLSELREKGNEIPFILFTGKGREEVAVKALNLGADRYFNKFGHPETVYGELAHGIRQAAAQRRAKQEIWDREERLRAILASSPDAMVITDLHGTITDCNFKTLKLLEASSRADIMGKHYHTLLTEKEQKKIGIAVKDLFEKGAITNPECRLLTKSGSEIPVEFSANILRDAYGKPVGAVGLARNITDRKKAEATLRQSERKFRNFFENSPDYCYIISPEGKILEVNKSALEALGYTKEEILGKNLLSAVYAPSSRRKAKKIFDTWKYIGRIRNEELEIVTKRGERRRVLLSVHSVKDVDGRLLHSVSVQKDITEHKKADEALRKSEKKYRNVVELSPDGIVTMNMKSTFTSVNKAFLELTGFSEDEIVGKHFTKLGTLRVRDVPKYAKLISSFLKGKKLESTEFVYLLKDGTQRLGEARLSLLEEKGKKIGVQSILRDITERKKAEDALRESEKRFRELSELLPEVIFETDIEGTLQFVNHAAYTQFGYSREEFDNGLTALQMIVPEDRDRAKENMGRLLRGETTVSNEYTALRKDGSTFPTIINSTPIIRGDRIVGLRGIMVDITERKKTEEALRQQQEILQLVTKNVSAGLTLISKEFRVLWTNETLLENVKAVKKGALCYSTLGQRNSVCPGCPVKEIFETGKNQVVSQQMALGHDNQEFHVEITATPIRDKKGNITAVLELAVPINDRIKMENAIREGEEKLRTLLDTANIIVHSVDANGNFVYVNKEWKKVLGYSDEDLKNLTLMDIIRSDHHNKCKEDFKQVISGKALNAKEAVFVSKHGKEINVMGNARAIFRDGKFISTVDSFLDITERKKAEDALKETLTKMEALNEKLGVIGKLTRHDARNKLSTITNNAYLAKNQLSNKHAASAHLAEIELAVDQMEKILEFSRIYELLGTEELSYVDVKKSLDEALLLLLGSDKIELLNECDGLMVRADSLLRQIFYNLIDNSLKHGEKVSHIKVYYTEEKDDLTLVYEDDGIGIQQDQKELIFREGYGKGSGYGLYLIKKICEAYNWTIHETGKLREGARFVITLPKLNKKWQTNYIIKKA